MKRARRIHKTSLETNEQLREQTAHTIQLVEYAQGLLQAISVFRLPEAADGRDNVVFNPWLERFPRGTISNCMSCHQRATLGYPLGSQVLVEPGGLKPDNPFFDKLRLDYLWSLTRSEATADDDD